MQIRPGESLLYERGGEGKKKKKGTPYYFSLRFFLPGPRRSEERKGGTKKRAPA